MNVSFPLQFFYNVANFRVKLQNFTETKSTEFPYYLLIHLPNFEQDRQKKLSYMVGLTYNFCHVTCMVHCLNLK